MKTSRWIIITLLIFAVVIGTLGCFGGGGGGGGDHYKAYGGVDPKGDYVVISVDMTANTLMYDNYSTSPQQHLGPYTFSKITEEARNSGFNILYETQIIPTADYSKPNCYAEFAIIDGVCVIYQMFDGKGTPNYDDDTTDGYPKYAFYRKVVNMNDYQGTAYNWVNFKMTPDVGVGAGYGGNFEAGFAAFDTNTTAPAGLLYGASYNNRAEVEDWYPNGIKNINDSDLATSSFTYDSTVVANKSGSLTLIGTNSGDFILDHGLNQGAGLAIRQAATNVWQSAYNGTYFVLVYKNNDASSAQIVEPIKIVLSGTGTAEVYDPIDAGTSSGSVNLIDVESFTGGPGGLPVADQFETISGCAGADSIVVRNAYNCRGGFVAGENEGLSPGSVVFAMMDPSGRYFCFTMFEYDDFSSTYNYQFGFGIKDQP